MDALQQILTAHAARYPRMEPRDAVKLVYQNVFGGGHLITDTAESLRRLRAEHACVAHDPAAPLLEDIGGGLVRVMLAAVDPDRYPLERLNGDFVRSARLHTGSREDLLQKLDLLRALARQGVFFFSAGGLEEFLSSYTASGCPALSHSEAYRAAYRPAYRVVLRSCLSLSMTDLILGEMERRKQTARPLLIAIDGRCASGKTTLAARLQAACGCGVVHLDDFFLRPEQRTRERYETPGENVDHERFLAEVLLPLRQGRAAEYRPFDCSTQRLAGPVRLEPSSAVVVEGSYSCHPALWPYYDLRIFLTISPEEQMKRITAREGAQYAEVFRRKWIPLEESYFAAYEPERRCDLSFACGSADPV